MSLPNRIGATRPGTWAIAKVVAPVQRRLLLATGGRVSLTGKPYERFFAETHERAIFVLQRPAPGA